MAQVSNLPIEDLAEMALQKPSDFGYWGSDDMFVTWGFSGIDVNDSSDCLDRSNFKVISNDLMQRFPDDFRIEGYKHWAVNHVDRLCCRILKDVGFGFIEQNITDAFKAAIDWHKKLEDYPIADEEDFSEEEMNECIDIIKNCFLDKQNMILKEDGWAEKIYSELYNLGFEMVPNYMNCNDEDIIYAAYCAQIWNKDEYEAWHEWCDANGHERINFVVEDPNQLSLFEDENE